MGQKINPDKGLFLILAPFFIEDFAAYSGRVIRLPGIFKKRQYFV
jgi:hypothetical protein